MCLGSDPLMPWVCNTPQRASECVFVCVFAFAVDSREIVEPTSVTGADAVIGRFILAIIGLLSTVIYSR